MRAAAAERSALTQARELHDEVERVAARLRAVELGREANERERGAHWEAADRARWGRIDAVIGAEEDKARAAREKEHKEREEAEKRRREEEERIRKEELTRRLEEERRRNEEEERKKKEAAYEEERKKQEAFEAVQTDELKRQTDARKSLGMTTPHEDWVEARTRLKVRFSRLLHVPCLLTSPTAIEVWAHCDGQVC
jgi:nucleoporin GLE1